MLGDFKRRMLQFSNSVNKFWLAFYHSILQFNLKMFSAKATFSFRLRQKHRLEFLGWVCGECSVVFMYFGFDGFLGICLYIPVLLIALRWVVERTCLQTDTRQLEFIEIASVVISRFTETDTRQMKFNVIASLAISRFTAIYKVAPFL